MFYQKNVVVQLRYQDYHQKKYLIIGLFTIITVITFCFNYLFFIPAFITPLLVLACSILHLVDMYVGRFQCCTQFLRKKLRTIYCVSLREHAKERECRRHLLRGAIKICDLRIGKDLAHQRPVKIVYMRILYTK